MKKPKPATIGERIARDCDFTWGYTKNGEKQIQAKLARRIDAVVKRAFLDGNAAGLHDGYYSTSLPHGAKPETGKAFAKYGVKARGK